MSRDVEITARVNGVSVTKRVPARTSLADFLRYDLELTGTHIGCEQGFCGACTVRVNGDIVRGCLMLAAQIDGAEVETVEGLSASGELADLQAAFLERNALQCGFCTPGMLLAAAELMARQPGAGREDIRRFISGNYCRCTGYEAIVDAIETVIKQRNGGGAANG